MSYFLHEGEFFLTWISINQFYSKMKQFYGFLFLTVLLFFNACSPKITTTLKKTYPALDYKQEVLVIELNQAEPQGAEQLGLVKIGDTGFSKNCGYDVVIDKAKLEARKAGGNAIKIVQHTPPAAFGSSCHQIKAKILRIENVDAYRPNEDEEVIPGIDYAILNVYRYSGPGFLVGYDLHLGDSVICRVMNNYKTTIHITKDGMNTLWARTEKKVEIPVNFKPGRTYYLRCGITMGAFVGHPMLELIDGKTGKAEFESFNAGNQ
jgi:hypothetical protein